jgi:toxin ParE1/3/4
LRSAAGFAAGLTPATAAYEYVAVDGVSAAGHFLARIREAAAILVRLPMAGRAGRIPGTRELVVPGTLWSIPYRVRQGFVDILAVIHAARQWPEEL